MDDIRPSQDNLSSNGSNSPKGTSTDNPVPESVSPGPVPDFGPPPKKSRTGTFVLAGLLVVALVGAGVYTLLQSDKDKAQTATTNSVVKKDIPNIKYVTLNSGWDTFYPGGDLSTNYLESNLATFEGLVRYENKTKLVPHLATSWTNPDDTTWVFTIKKGVKFHTGREMTTEDVKLSFDEAKDSDFGEIFGGSIASITVNSPTQVTIKTDGPDATLLKKLANYFVYDTKSGKKNDSINGTGPFVQKSGTTATQNSLELVAFDQYHGGRVHVRSLSFIGSEDRDNSKLFDENKADIIDSEVPNVKRAHNTLSVEPTSVFELIPNTLKANSPLSKLEVRQAINLAMDAKTLATVRNAIGEPIGQVVPATVTGYNPDIKPPVRNIAKAKELLKAAGYPNGVTITFSYFAPSQPTAEEIARQLAEIGIKLKFDPIADVKTLSTRAATGDMEFYFQTYGSDIQDASDVLSYFIDTPNYRNPEAVKLVKDAQATFDSAKRLEMLQKATKLVSDDLGVIPVYTPKSAPITYNPNIVLTREVNNNNLGVYWFKVYGK